jgi:hypothetical protein
MPLQQTSGNVTADAYGGGVAVEPNYIESCFSTYLYTGNGTDKTIVNGVDLSTNGGLVWIKSRSAAYNHWLSSPTTGTSYSLISNLTDALTNIPTGGVTAFNTTGFDLTGNNQLNANGQTYTSWSFAKTPKFFDVVTYTGDGTSGQAVAHNLKSFPGAIFVKRTDAASNWGGWIRTSSTAGAGAISLNSTAASFQTLPNSYIGTDTVFYPQWIQDKDTNIGNTNGGTYVAYLFAHNAGGFGLTGTDNVISCGSYVETTGANAVNLGYEPQWLLVKNASVAEDWWLIDTMRGMTVAGLDALLRANTSGAELSSGGNWYPTATGFANDAASGSGDTYIYIAIRRGPMKVPTDATKVFAVDTLGSTADGQLPGFRSSFPVDLNLALGRGSGGVRNWGDRLRGNVYLASNSTTAEASNGYFTFDYMNGAYNSTSTLSSLLGYMFRRAPSFFDEVCYDGTSTTRTQTHGLQAVPELIFVKRRSSTSVWFVYSATYGRNYYAFLNLTDSFASDVGNSWGTTDPTSTTFGLSPITETNASGNTYVAYLFATCAGVSKVGSYTGTGTTLQVDCGFTSGARFVLIKRTDLGGAWYVWDSARGIVSGNDPYLLLNSTAAEVTTTDYIDTYSAGFEISSTAPAAINASGGTFIFFAIA